MNEEIKRVRILNVIWTLEGAVKAASINAAKRVSRQGERGVRAFGREQRAEGLRLVRSLGWT